MLAAMDVVGNPSSVHREGRAAKAIVEKARAQVADLVGCDRSEVVFTSGATEAAAAVAHALHAEFGFVSAACEHDAVRAHKSIDLSLALDRRGRLALERVDEDVLGALTPMDIIAVQSANSETGILQDISSVCGYVKDRAPKAQILSDVVQSCGKDVVDLSESGVDLALVSGHKFGGPKGCGAVILRKGGDSFEGHPLIAGGGQEMGRRSGTENVIGIAGFGAAAEAAQRDLAAGVWEKVAELRNILETALASGEKETIFVGIDAPRLPNTSCFATPGWKGETQVMAMDLAGFAISAGSACSSGKVKASRVLRAMGYGDDVAGSAIRVSLGPTTKKDEILRFADAWLAAKTKFRQRAA
jgi:cysteine desulfurase